MSEEPGQYAALREHEECGDVQHIGEILRQLIEERDWPIPQDRPESGRRRSRRNTHEPWLFDEPRLDA